MFSLAICDPAKKNDTLLEFIEVSNDEVIKVVTDSVHNGLVVYFIGDQGKPMFKCEVLES